MGINFLALALASLSTLVVGAIWYNPKVFGTIWMKESGTPIEKMQGANMVLIFGMSLFYAFLIALVLQALVIHQMGAFGTVGGNVQDPQYIQFMEAHGTKFRTFKHGALHGFLSGLFFALPVIGVGSLYERRSWKYVLIAGGYWVVSCMIMGAIICGMK